MDQSAEPIASYDLDQVVWCLKDLHHEEDVQAPQGDGVDGEEVTGRRAGGLGADEVPPPVIFPAGAGPSR